MKVQTATEAAARKAKTNRGPASAPGAAAAPGAWQ